MIWTTLFNLIHNNLFPIMISISLDTLLTILKNVFIAVMIACVITAIKILKPELIARYKRWKEKELAINPYDLNPHYGLVPFLFILIYFIRSYSVLQLLQPWVAYFYWLAIVGLTFMVILSLFLYYRMYGVVWRNENNFHAQAVKAKLKQSISITLALYTALIAQSTTAPKYLILIFFLYFLLEKAYIRIIKQKNFRDESAIKQNQSRLNNKLLLAFPFWCLIMQFVGVHIGFILSWYYILGFILYYNRRIKYQPFIVTKAPIGSPARFEVMWEAVGMTIAEAPLFQYKLDIALMEEDQLDNHCGSTELGDLDPDIFHIWSLAEYREEMALSDMHHVAHWIKNIRIYDVEKLYPVHEYYLWWWMRDVPFYFGIRAFWEMVWDCSLVLVWTVVIAFYMSIWTYIYIVFCKLSDEAIDILFWQVYSVTYFLILICCYLKMIDFRRLYAWCAFFHRAESYQIYDPAAPYAMYGPTVDGPHNWQYWFFVCLGYFPSRALVLQRELLEEERRLAEEYLQLSIDSINYAYDEDDDEQEDNIIWNPIEYLKVRRAPPEKQKEMREKIIRERKMKIDEKQQKEWLKTLKPLEWWTHYSI